MALVETEPDGCTYGSVHAWSRPSAVQHGETQLALTRMETSTLELDEGLEQLRALQAGFSIQIVDSDFHSLAVDTPADLQRVIAHLTEAD